MCRTKARGEGRDAFAVQEWLEAEVEVLERLDRQERQSARGAIDRVAGVAYSWLSRAPMASMAVILPLSRR